MIKPGDAWGVPTTAAPDAEIRGSDAELAAMITPGGPPRLIRFLPVGSDLAASVGLAEAGPSPSEARGIELSIDAITTPLGLAINSVVVGVSPTRLRAHQRSGAVRVMVDERELFSGTATTVVVANGQFLEGADLVPRGHPGDGRLEVQVYALTPSERRPMRRRLATGTHVPHPRIVSTSGRTIEISGLERPWTVRRDRLPDQEARTLALTVLPHAVRLLI